jgi:hypothetical protein
VRRCWLLAAWVACALPGRVQAQQPLQKPACPANALLKELDGGKEGAGALLIRPDLDPTSRTTARVALDALLQTCDAHQPLQVEQGAVFFALFSKHDRPTLKDTASEYLKDQNVVSPFFSTAFGAGGGVPVPKKVMIGLSQVTSAGQPGFLVSVAGTPAPTSKEHPWLRHSSISGSVLLVQPSTPSATSTVPQSALGALELVLGYNSRRTPYDWSAEVADKGADILDVGETNGLLAVAALLTSYADAAATIATETANEAIANARKDAAAAAAGELARRRFREAMARYWLDTFIRPELDRENTPSHVSLAVQLRYSDDTRFAPEMPDLLNASLAAGAYAAFLSAQTSLAAYAHGAAGFSGYPRTTCPARGEAGCEVAPALLLDADAGLSAFGRIRGTGPRCSKRA